MYKQEFLFRLKSKLKGLPEQDVDERVNFYSEIIDDRIEEGVTEQDAVSELGDVNKIASQIISDVPFIRIVKDRINKKRKFSAWEIVLISIGSPIWLSLLIALFAVIFSLYVSLWAVVVSAYAVEISLIACAFAGVVGSIVFCIVGNVASALAIYLSGGLICAGLSIFLFYGCKSITKTIIFLTKKLAMFIKNCFIKRGNF